MSLLATSPPRPEQCEPKLVKQNLRFQPMKPAARDCVVASFLSSGLYALAHVGPDRDNHAGGVQGPEVQASGAQHKA